MAESKKEADKDHDNVLKVSATTCPRCSADFVCNAADIKQCQCWGVGLGPDEFTYLKQQGFSATETGCLCRNCLLEIQREVADTANNSSSA
jgi:hypothetical protein